MKKFITTIPRQPNGKLHDGVYLAADNKKLENTIKTCFPILLVINAFCEAGEDIVVEAIYAKNYGDCKLNYEKFSSALSNLCKNRGITYKLNTVNIPVDESTNTHLESFSKLIDRIENGDQLYADITYGTKPTPIVEIMALSYGVQTKDDVSVECICYGEMDHNLKKLKIYDVTSLFYMDEIVNSLAKMKIHNPSEVIKSLINNEE